MIYASTLGFGFAYDDATVVTHHPLVESEAWGAIARSAYHVGTDVRVPTGAYRPLTIASLALNHVVSGTNPWSYHLTNVLLHALVSALVVLLAVQLGLSPGAALAGALAFAVHPVHAEAVANVAGRAEGLSTVLALSALIAYTRRRLMVFAILLGGALLAKENVVTIIGVVALWELLRPRPQESASLAARMRAAALPLVAAAIPIAAYLAARVAILGGLGLAPGSVTSIENPIVGLAPLPRAATVLSVFGRAVSLVLTPVRLSPDYGFAEISPALTFLAPGPILGAVFLLGLAGLLAWTWRRAPTVAFLTAASLVTYSIVSNAFVVIGTVLGDRLLYLPSVFVCILFGVAVSAARARGGRMVAIAGVTIVLFALSIRCATYAAVWRDDATLFTYAARVAPRSVRALGGFAEILLERRQPGEARAVLDEAVSIAPDFAPNRLNRAAANLALGDLDAAEADARHVLALDPANAFAKLQLDAVARRREGAPARD